MSTPYLIGLTGGVASGKSSAARCFEQLGVAVADADLAAREAVAPGSDGLAEVVSAFGASALAADGTLDRAAMRRRVFADDDARMRLEAIVHPRVRTLLEAACIAAPGAYAIAAIPLLAESGGRDVYPWLDRILVIDRGRLVYDGDLPGLSRTVGAERVLVVDLAEATDDLTGIAGTRHLGSEGHGLRQRLAFDAESTTAARVLAAVSEHAEVLDLTVEEPDIEDVVRRIYAARR